jgi:hypothetical protein
MKRVLFPLLLVAALTGCEKGDPKSPYDLSVSQGQTAMRFAGQIAEVRGRIEGREKKAKELSDSFPKAADKLGPEADPKLVRDIVRAADRAGDDGAYAAEMRRLDEVRSFVEAEHAELVKKIGGAASYAAKQSGCSADVYGPIGSALKTAVDDRAKERLRANNDALLLIDRHRDRLGARNVPILEQLADDLAATSYTVRRELPSERDRLTRLSAAARDAEKSLDRLIADERKIQDDASSSADEKKASSDWIKAAESEKAKLETARKDLDERLKTHEERRKAALKAYEEGLSGLEKSLKDKAGDKSSDKAGDKNSTSKAKK